MLAERAAILECQEALLWESDGGKSEKILRRKAELIDRIDDSLSAAIVTKRQEWRGKARQGYDMAVGAFPPSTTRPTLTLTTSACA